MSTKLRLSIAAAVLASVVGLPGCKDTPLSAGSDYTMTLIAQPSSVLINPEAGIYEGQTTISATILNAESIPQSGITVYFSNAGGTLTPSSGGVKTNSGGVATSTLLITSDDPAEVDVTATSGALTQLVKILKTTVAINQPPTAAIAASPQDEQATGSLVIFDGTGSSDPDATDFITMYKWVITSTNPDTGKPNPIISEGPGVSGVSFPSDVTTAFTNLQDLTVTLLVTDDPNAPALYSGGQVVAYRAQQTIPYRITAVRCDNNTAPTAVIAGATTQQIYGAPTATVNFLANGTLSSDRETAIETYTWNCGNGSNPLPQGTGSTVICKYVVDQTPRTYTLTLVVTDRGTGTLVNGAYECAKASTAASIQVVVTPLAGG